MKKTCVFFLFSLFLKSSLLLAQTTDPELHFRVVAVQNGEDRIESVSNEINVSIPVKLYVPNAFTPNGDGLNDTFGVKGEGWNDYHLQVFNRWGQQVFESSDPSYQWDGTYQGQLLMEGAYVYQIQVATANTPATLKRGTVLLITSNSKI